MIKHKAPDSAAYISSKLPGSNGAAFAFILILENKSTKKKPQQSIICLSPRGSAWKKFGLKIIQKA
jgi:hypothetical protein